MNLQDFLQPSPPINEEQFENYLQKLTSFISSEESDHFPNEALEKLFLHWNAGTKNVALKLSFFNLIARILYREDQEIMWQECQKKLNNEDILEVIHNLSNISKSREFSNFGFKFITEGIIKFLTSEDKDSNVAFGLLLTNKLLANEQLQTEVLNVWPEAFANCTRWLKSHDCKVQREILNFFRHFTSKSLLVNEKCLLTVEQLNDILLILCSLSDKERICQDLHWFGGHGKVGTKANLRLFVSLSLELLVLVQCSENWQRMYSQICSKFTSASEFIELFLDHDDMLMQMLFCVCKIHSKFSAKEESIICPHGLWLSVLLEIDFDHQILIDWLTSEPMAIQSILTYLKLLQQEWQSFVQISSQHQSPPKGPINSLAPCQKSDSMCILVEENVYGEARQLEVHLCAATEDPTEHEQQNTKTENQEPIWQRTLDMIIKLRLKIERLDSKELFPFNPTALVRAIENIENITDSG